MANSKKESRKKYKTIAESPILRNATNQQKSIGNMQNTFTIADFNAPNFSELVPQKCWKYATLCSDPALKFPIYAH